MSCFGEPATIAWICGSGSRSTSELSSNDGVKRTPTSSICGSFALTTNHRTIARKIAVAFEHEAIRERRDHASLHRAFDSQRGKAGHARAQGVGGLALGRSTAAGTSPEIVGREVGSPKSCAMSARLPCEFQSSGPIHFLRIVPSGPMTNVSG